MFERVIGLTAASLGPEHPFMARHLSNLAQLYWATGDIDKAFSARARVVAMRERNLPLQLSVGSERQKLAYFEPALADMEETIAFHVSQAGRNPAARDLAVTTVLQRKGRIFDALADNISAFQNASHTRRSDTARGIIPGHLRNWRPPCSTRPHGRRWRSANGRSRGSQKSGSASRSKCTSGAPAIWLPHGR